MFQLWAYSDGLAGGNEQPADPRERERIARISGAALWTFGPNGVPVPMPFVLPDGSIAIGIKARTGPTGGGGSGSGGVFDPYRDVKVLLKKVSGSDLYSGQYAPGEAYSWPVVARPDVFIQPGSASGFPVKDFFCRFETGICDQLTRAQQGAGRNPCWGKPGATCDFKQPISGPGLAPASSSPISGAATSSGASRTATAPSKVAPESILSAGGGILDQVSSAVGLPTKVDVAGFSISPALIGIAALGILWFTSRR